MDNFRKLYIRKFLKGMRWVHNIKEVRDLVEINMYIKGKTIKIGDLSKLDKRAISALLKFIEETQNNIICYASMDNLGPVIVSRFTEVIKENKFKIGFGSFESFLDSEELYPITLLNTSAESFFKFRMYSNLNYGLKEKLGRHI